MRKANDIDFLDPCFKEVKRLNKLSEDNYTIVYYALYKGLRCLLTINKHNGFLDLEKDGL
jgi:hypothetical protein